MTNINNPKHSIGVVTYNGDSYKPELIGNITANRCDANKNTEFRLNMNNVSYTPNSHLNLFKIIKQLRKC